MSVPREAFGLIGRARERSALAELCKSSRLVTLWGAGGVGKTRLASSIARDAGQSAWFCDLSSASDLIGFCAAMAYQLGVAQGDEPLRDIGQWLARRGPALLVLDNFEQLTHLASVAIVPLLDRASELHILVTSRERLRLSEEMCYELGPLGLPSATHDLHASEAYRMLAARVRAFDPGFAWTEGDAPHVVELLSALEGMPLAIELAAPRVALLGVPGLLQRLDRRLDALDAGARGLPPRQTSLRESIRWSFDLLAPDEQRALAWCSLFRGGLAIDAADAMFGPHGLALVQALRDASLLRTLRPGRFAAYDSVREFASEQLDALGERLTASQRHAAVVIERCERLARDVEHGQPLAPLIEERWNLEQALRWSLAAGDREHAVRAALALAPVLTSQGPLHYLLDALGQTLALTPGDPRLTHARGKVLQGLGRLRESERDLRLALEAASDVTLRACILKDLGVLHHQRREVDEAARCYAQALELATASKDLRLCGICIGNSGALRHDTSDYAAAQAQYEEALAALRSCADLRSEGVFLTNLAVLQQELNQLARARADYQRAIEILRGLGDLRGQAVAIENLAVLEHLDGNLEHSREHHERALGLLETVGDERSEALCHARLGAVLAQLGEPGMARGQLERAAALQHGRDDGVARDVIELHRAFVELAEGDRVAALARLRAARSTSSGRSLVALSDDARAAAAALEAWLAKNSRARLTVGAGGAWFQCGDGAEQSLGTRPTHARLLAHLADLHADDPEHRASVQQLFEIGWRGEAASHDSQTNRVHVALAQLRKLGLAAVLQSVDEGYRLDPQWLVVRRRA